MAGIRNEAQAVALGGDISGTFRPVRHEVTFRRKPDVGAAMQYLAWALEEIEKAGSRKAACHTRAAMAALRKDVPPTADKD